MKQLLIFILLFLALSSCVNEPKEIKNGLKGSGFNKRELIKVYDHYKNSNDTLKLKAAIFIINQLEEQYSFDSTDVYDIDKYFPYIGSLKKTNRGNVLDSLKLLGVWPAGSSSSLTKDIKTISANFIILNIDLAFDEWNQASWKNKYSFEIFCEYVLPYKVSRLPNEKWRNILFKKNKDFIFKCSIDSSHIFTFSNIYKSIDKDFFVNPRNIYPQSIPFKYLASGKVGSCDDCCNFLLMNFRSIGLPVVMDYTPQWANSSYGHSWVSLLLPNHKPIYFLHQEKIPHFYKNYIQSVRVFNNKVLLYDEKDLTNGEFCILLNSGIFKPGFVNTSSIPKNIDISEEKKVAKIFRSMYSIQKDNLIDIANKYNEIIPQNFQNRLSIDVTDTYIDCKDVTLNIEKGKFKSHFVYLCLFDKIRGFFPIYWAFIDKYNQACFKKMGCNNILYFPMYFDNDTFQPAGSPFILKNDGTMKILSPSHSIESVELLLKYPLQIRFVHYANYMLNGVFQGANDPDFKNSTNLFKIKKTPLYWNEELIKDSKQYRYLRFLCNDTICDLAEMEFYNNNTLIKGKVICSKSKYDYPAAKAFDGDMETFTHGAGKASWVGLDLGENKHINITKIRYCPRNNSNMIKKGDVYELFYWDNKWNSLGKKVGVKKYLEYSNVPKGAVLFLKNSSGGIEERPFTYENGKQVWW